MTSTAAPALPGRIPVIPEVAQEALLRHLESGIATWSILRVADDGDGRLDRTHARQIVRQGRSVSDRQARRLLRAGDATFWSLDPDGSVRLHGAARLAAGLGIERVSSPHLIPLEDLRGGRAQLRASLAATVYRTDDGGRPISRAEVEARTGVPPSTQRRYENQYGHARRVTPVQVHVSHVTDPDKRRAVAAYFGREHGFYVGRHGDLMRRHPDIRQAAKHAPGSSSVARRLNHQLREQTRGARPVHKAHGQRAPRVFFLAPANRPGSGARAFLKATDARGKGEPALDPRDYSVIESRDRKGRRRYESAVAPSEPRPGRHSGGSLRRDLETLVKPGSPSTPPTPAQTMSGQSKDGPDGS